MILHLCTLDKFIKPFYDFGEAHFEDFHRRHQFYVGVYANGKSDIYEAPCGENVFLVQEHQPTQRILWLMRHMNRADKIILHGLWGYQVLLLLTAQPWLLQKCYWTIWGGDLYVRHAKNKSWRQHVGEAIRRIVIRRLGHCVTYIKADYELARQWHGAKGQWHDCLIYPSNLYRELPTQNADHVGINILVGNSAYTSNDHKEVLDRLMPYAQENIKIYCPLSYGDEAYAREVSEYGKAMYGSKFVALLKYMPLDEYLQLLAKMDIAIFNHKRQQGMGNITTLLGTGKKVYLRQEVTPYFMFKNLGVQVLPVDEFDLERIAPDVSRLNSERIKQYFSSDHLATQWRQIVSSGISE